MQLFDSSFDRGSVWLVGAGPGDPGLLTLLAYKSIKEADIIFYDALLNEQILSLAKSNAQLVYVGKRGNKKSINQLEINKLLINEAKKNKRVLRLKGGDPFIFGRGGEEALSLKLNKIPYTDFRRNIVTEGIELNSLVKKEIEIGTIKILPYEICKPCLHLEQMVSGKDIIKEFLRRGGLRCEVLVSGKVKIGDKIRIL